MKTDIITISSEGNNMDAALTQIDKISAYKGLSRKDTGNVNGEFWLEDQDGVYELHLLVKTLVDEKIRGQLLAASSSGKNEAARGFMGKIRCFFEPTYGIPMFSAGIAGGTPQMYESYTWSMEDYRDQLRQHRELDQRNDQEDWDELERSVVANLADDVRVGIKNGKVDMEIYKTFKS